jgi:hypothetical protein
MLYTDFQDVLVLSFAVALRHHNCCTGAILVLAAPVPKIMDISSYERICREVYSVLVFLITDVWIYVEILRTPPMEGMYFRFIYSVTCYVFSFGNVRKITLQQNLCKNRRENTCHNQWLYFQISASLIAVIMYQCFIYCHRFHCKRWLNGCRLEDLMVLAHRKVDSVEPVMIITKSF